MVEFIDNRKDDNKLGPLQKAKAFFGDIKTGFVRGFYNSDGEE